MTQTITQSAALALAYFKEGYPYGDDNHILFELVSNGGDLEFFIWVLEQIIPITEQYLEQFTLEGPDKYYLFYGDAYPEQLKALLSIEHNPTRQIVEQCIDKTLDIITQQMRDIRQ